MSELPISQIVPLLLEKLANSPTIILSAPPGTGKSSELPAIIYEKANLSGKILVLEPRRMAARALAKRLAWRLKCSLGDLVGFSVRHERVVSPKTVIEVVTEGVLTRRLLSDPFLEGVAMVILDDFHERSVEADLALAALRETQQISPLKLLIMSATMDSKLSTHLPEAEQIVMAYEPFPLTITYLPQEAGMPLEKQIYHGVKALLADQNDDGGDILAFLPGQREIENTAAFLRQFNWPNLTIKRLYGALPAHEQDAILNAANLPAERRLILSTNIAETSLTVPRVRAVIDSGLQKSSHYDPYSGLMRLTTGRASLASAVQRSGRAARLGPGRAIRLWSKREELSLAPFRQPEILTCDPATPLLWMAAMQPGWYNHFPFLDEPPKEIWDNTLNFLINMGLLSPDGQRLTTLGEKVSNYPLAPRLGLMLTKALASGRPYLGATLAALLAGRDIIASDALNDLGGDVTTRIELLFTWERESGRLSDLARYSLEAGAVSELIKAREQLLSLLKASAPKERPLAKELENEIILLLISAYLDNLAAACANDNSTYTMASGRGLRLAMANFPTLPKFLLVLNAREGERGRHSRAILDLFLPITKDDLTNLAAKALSSKEEYAVNSAGEVTVSTATYYGQLELWRQRGGPTDRQKISAALFRAAQEADPSRFAPIESLTELRLRLELMATLLPQEDFPTFETLFNDTLATLTLESNSFSDLKEKPWLHLMEQALPWPKRTLLAELLPKEYVLPRGKTTPIHYQKRGENCVAVIAVHIQELYGLNSHPTIGHGRLPLLIELLAPSGRPTQITADLPSFWRESYPQVRKELFGRYPKHFWPEDPLKAASCGLGRRR